ncbi:MAG: SIMPL domain-containing protein [Planctomycetales bacterium]|nr:SIMPL domain-containing protein [Planctomycetales bacterium]
MKRMICGILVLAFSCQAAVRAEESRTISVSGHGEASAKPDMASFNVAVVTQASTAGEAMAANSSAATKVLEALKALGIAESDIRTNRLDVNPNYVNARNNEAPRITGYTATNQVFVEVRKLEDLGRVLDAVVEAGGNQLSGISFDIRDKVSLLDRARAQAVRDARRRAEIIADVAGIRVGRVMSIQESGSGGGPPVPMARAFAAVPIASGEQSLSVGVNVTYEIAE